MAKVKVIDPQGMKHDGVHHPEGTELELTGPFLDAATRFKQVEPVKEKPAEKSESAEPAKKK